MNQGANLTSAASLERAKKELVNARRILNGESIPREKSHKERSAAFFQEMENEQ